MISDGCRRYSRHVLSRDSDLQVLVVGTWVGFDSVAMLWSILVQPLAVIY